MEIKNIEDLKLFLEKFEISQKNIDEFLKKKKLIEKNQNIFLSDIDFKKNQIHTDLLVFIKLKNMLASTYLLKFIKNNTKPIEIKSQKQALNYTYSKSLLLDSIKYQNLVQNKYYIVEYKENIIGYCEFDKTKKIPLINKMNIGEYLHEE